MRRCFLNSTTFPSKNGLRLSVPKGSCVYIRDIIYIYVYLHLSPKLSIWEPLLGLKYVTKPETPNLLNPKPSGLKSVGAGWSFVKMFYRPLKAVGAGLGFRVFFVKIFYRLLKAVSALRAQGV